MTIQQILIENFNTNILSNYADGDESTTSNGPGVGSLEPEIQSVPTDEMQLPQEWTY